MTPFTLSVIIPNFNYEAYVGQAIDSALDLDWPDVEVIVIDDGSTDGSRAVIERYGSRISTIFQQNSGQLVACNKGFAMSRGEVVIFLDSDDVLLPSLARELAAVWTPRTSKVQVQMRTIDAQGAPLGSFYPNYHGAPSPRQVTAWCASAAAYPTPPGSGNAYARAFLDQIFPLENTCGTANDSYCLAAAPFLGDVVTIVKPLVSYRIHGKNQGALSKLDVHQFERQVTRGRQRAAYARTIAARAGVAMADDAIDRNLSYLCYRLGSLRLAAASHPIEGDSALRVLADVWAACFTPQGVSAKGRLATLAWALSVCLSPPAWASRLILWRFAPGTRPHALRGFLTKLRVVRG